MLWLHEIDGNGNALSPSGRPHLMLHSSIFPFLIIISPQVFQINFRFTDLQRRQIIICSLACVYREHERSDESEDHFQYLTSLEIILLHKWLWGSTGSRLKFLQNLCRSAQTIRNRSRLPRWVRGPASYSTCHRYDSGRAATH
jgi:hypothetical protein